MTKAKVLQVCAIDMSVENLLKPLILESMERGYEVHSACTDTGKFKQLEVEGLIMKNIEIDRQISPMANWRSVMALYRLIRKEQYDIIHVHTPMAALLGRVAAKMAGAKNIIYTAHGFYFHEDMPKKQYDLFNRIEKYAAKYLTDWLLLQSKEDCELALQQKFKPVNRTMHLSNGVDIWRKFNKRMVCEEQKQEFRREAGIAKGDFVFAFAGRLVREKGLFELAEAFKKLVAHHPNAKLLVIGDYLDSERDQDSREQLKRELDHPDIHCLGYRKDLPLLLSVADAYVLPSYREGLPRSIIEAMAMGKAIIATDIRGCREEVFEGKNGFLIKPHDAGDLLKAMERLIASPELTARFGIKSRELAEQYFDEAKVLHKQIELFDSLMRHPRAKRALLQAQGLGKE